MTGIIPSGTLMGNMNVGTTSSGHVWVNQTTLTPVTTNAITSSTFHGWNTPFQQRRRLSAFQKRLGLGIRSRGRDLPGEVAQHYTSVATESLTEIFAGWNPVHQGKPKKEVMPLLEVAGHPRFFSMQYSYKAAGMVLLMPPLPGRRRTAARLTAAGLGLLDHWAEKHPRFKPFVDAYVSKKARGEILSLCFDMDLGAVPKLILDEKVKAETMRVALKKRTLKAVEDFIVRNRLLDLESNMMRVGGQLYQPLGMTPMSATDMLRKHFPKHGFYFSYDPKNYRYSVQVGFPDGSSETLHAQMHWRIG